MGLSCHQRRLLGRIDAAVCRSDPRLASMLAIFGQLTAGEQMPSHEQLRTPVLGRVRAMILTAAAAAAALFTRAAGMCARALHSAATACTAAARALAGRRLTAWRAAPPGSAAADTSARGPAGQPGPSPP